MSLHISFTFRISVLMCVYMCMHVYTWTYMSCRLPLLHSPNHSSSTFKAPFSMYSCRIFSLALRISSSLASTSFFAFKYILKIEYMSNSYLSSTPPYSCRHPMLLSAMRLTRPSTSVAAICESSLPFAHIHIWALIGRDFSKAIDFQRREFKNWLVRRKRDASDPNGSFRHA